MPPKYPLSNKVLKQALRATKGATVAAALTGTGVAAACPTFPTFENYAQHIACSTIPEGTTVEVTTQPTNGKLLFVDLDNDGDADELFYFSIGNEMPDSFDFTATGGAGVITDAGTNFLGSDEINSPEDDDDSYSGLDTRYSIP